MDWKGKVAVVTGASSGIGRETALELGRRGTTVVLAARRLDRLLEVGKLIEESGGRSVAFETDVSSESDVGRLFQQTIADFGRLDWLINNAGSGLYASVEETTSGQMETLWRVNFMGTFYCIRAAIPLMKKQGHGHILTVSSMSGRRGAPLKAAYCVTKFAQVGLMDSLRRELEGIFCTTVYPGATETEFIQSSENPGHRHVRNYGPVQSAAEVARAIVHTIEHPAIEVITQKMGRTMLILNAISPALVDWLAERTIRKKSGRS